MTLDAPKQPVSWHFWSRIGMNANQGFPGTGRRRFLLPIHNVPRVCSVWYHTHSECAWVSILSTRLRPIYLGFVPRSSRVCLPYVLSTSLQRPYRIFGDEFCKSLSTRERRVFFSVIFDENFRVSQGPNVQNKQTTKYQAETHTVR